MPDGKPTFEEEPFKPYALAIGQVALAWNDLHESLSLLFCMICGAGPANPHLAVWHSVDYDRAKRKMLFARCNALTDRQAARWPRLYDDIKWLADKADSVEDARNDAVHAPLSLPGPLVVHRRHQTVTPDDTLNNRRAVKLGMADLEADFRWCREHALKLRDFADAICRSLPKPETWPDKPQWRKRPHRPGRPEFRVRLSITRRTPPPGSSRA